MEWLALDALLIAAFCLWRRRRVHVALRAFTASLKTRSLSDDPEVSWVDGFLTDAEVERLKRRARRHFRPSKVTGATSRSGTRDVVRTSETATLSGFRFDPIVPIVKAKAAHLVGCSVSHIEILQVVRYQAGQHYDSHLDGIDFGQYPKERARGQRTHTVLAYLQEPSAGSGSTEFPKLDLSVSPKRGAAIVFGNCMPDGTLDGRTLHAGRPVEGERAKWAVNIWVRDRRLPVYAR